MTKPLKWSIDWEHLTFKQRFLMGAPFVATEDKVHRDILQQLNGRTEADIAAWDTYSAEVSQLAKDVAARLKVERIWPSSIFLPDDPADIPLGGHFGQTDRYDLAPAAFAIVEEEAGIKLNLAFWEGLSHMTYVQAVEQMIRQKAEQAGGTLRR